MQTGLVKFFNGSKGYGFIAPDDGARDVFCHVTQVADGVSLRENDRVQYEIGEGRDGRSMATGVRLVE